MPALSIVIPVFEAEEYLPGCLDTVVDGGGDELEVVVVDDCSPDGSRAVAERYAARDGRITVVTTPVNAGSGPARNFGLAQAKGDYVWFVDADDELKPGAVERVLAAVRGPRPPDVVLVQHEKRRDTGVIETGELPELAAHCPADPSGFTLAEWPRIVDYTHTPWTKVSRREFLTGIDLGFPTGWYTDIPWTYALLRRAERIAVVVECCYQWRQRAGSSITRTRDDRHFDVFTQWQRTWDDFEGVDDAGVRVALFNHMVWHLLLVIGNTERVEPKKRREFFRRTSELYRRYHPGPDAWQPAAGVTGLKQRLLAARAYVGYEAFRQVYRLAKRVNRNGPQRGPGPVPVPEATASEVEASSANSSVGASAVQHAADEVSGLPAQPTLPAPRVSGS
ncbi:glycosyltransferase family 2 protein [Glycomyces tritici]|uniref:Glycosyltransferase family 2 protein n=1 Tax=Glycomyces tritici TaxID=2665176 RepID=A0ABT7YP93_9ACTN|nr:glycosyltransferase family 2 protein [Glycomyces tritici]MDN3240457.1 glycosyltransferase family 2 protein [Glycomyces tritici]